MALHGSCLTEGPSCSFICVQGFIGQGLGLGVLIVSPHIIAELRVLTIGHAASTRRSHTPQRVAWGGSHAPFWDSPCHCPLCVLASSLLILSGSAELRNKRRFLFLRGALPASLQGDMERRGGAGRTGDIVNIDKRPLTPQHR